jgi:hypothetical protein
LNFERNLMPSPKSLSQLVESYRFWDVVRLWARERLEHEDIVARALAGAVVRDGLRLQSLDARWVNDVKHNLHLNGQPYVGFCATPQGSMCILRSTALEHMLAIIHRAETPSEQKLAEEFITREDFLSWCEQAGVESPKFWCSG